MDDEQRKRAEARMRHIFDQPFVSASIDFAGASPEQRVAHALEYIAAQLGEIRSSLNDIRHRR